MRAVRAAVQPFLPLCANCAQTANLKMGKKGGPCMGPGVAEGTICGITEIPDSCNWRRGTGVHGGKACCTKRECEDFLLATTRARQRVQKRVLASGGEGVSQPLRTYLMPVRSILLICACP